MYDPKVNYELLPTPPQDETEVNLRSYFSRLSDERLMEYDPSWTDEQVMAWDDNFTSDGELFLICCEREVDVAEYRRVLAEHMELRELTPKAK